MNAFDRRQLITTGLVATTATAAVGPRVASAQDAQAKPLTPVTELGVQRDYGGDQTAAFQLAVDKAAAARTPLFLPAGTYRLRKLTLKPDTHISGVAGRSVLIQDGVGPFIEAEVADNMRLLGLVVEGGRQDKKRVTEHALFYAKDCQQLLLSDCKFVGAGADGVVLRRCSGTITLCSFTDIAGTGIFSNDAKGLEITHNTLSSCGNNGVQVWRSAPGEDATIIAHNRIERVRADAGGSGQNGNGVALFRAGSVIVQGNRISDCAFSAIRANSVSNVQMIANNCARLGEVALYAEFAFQGAVIANNIVDRAAAGISITNYKDHGGRLAVAQGNLIRNLFQKRDSGNKRGFGIAVEADSVVSGNVIEDAPGIGVAIGWGASMRDVTATANIIRGARIGIGVSVDAQAGYGFITNNMISGATEGAIRAMNHHIALGPDLATASSESYRNIAVFGNVAT